MRRRRDREGDVVTTVVITVEAILLIHSFGLFGSQLVLRLPCCSVGLNKGHLLVGGLSECNFLATKFALCAVLADHEELLNFFADDRELGLADRLLPAAEIVVAEDQDLLVLFILGEHRVNQEDRRQEGLRLCLIRYFVTVIHVEEFILRHDAEVRVLDRCLFVPLLLGHSEIFAFAQLRLDSLPLLTLVGRVGKSWVLTLEANISKSRAEIQGIDNLVSHRYVGNWLVGHWLVGHWLVDNRLVGNWLVDHRLVGNWLMGNMLVGKWLVDNWLVSHRLVSNMLVGHLLGSCDLGLASPRIICLIAEGGRLHDGISDRGRAAAECNRASHKAGADNLVLHAYSS